MISWSLGFTQQSPAWWSPGPYVSHNNHRPGDLLVLQVHTTINRLVISWSFGFTQQSPAWWSPGTSGSHYNQLPGDLLVLRVHTTITCLVISWSLRFTQQSPAWWSPSTSGSHNNQPPGDVLVLWVHTTITRLVISWSFRFTQNEIARLFTWNSIKVHVLGCCRAANRIIFACHSNTYLGVTYATKHIPSTYSIQIGDPRLAIFPCISSMKAILPSSCMVSSSLVPYW